MRPSPVSPPVALSIAGSDCSAGAGLQADLKTFAALGVYGLTAVTCIVAEVPGKVSRIQPVEPAVLDAQIDLLLRAFPVAAIKTGMLFSAANIRLVAERLKAVAPADRPWLVVDPVMAATSGDALIEDDAVAAYCDALFPLADLITPNMHETSTLLGTRVESQYEAAAAAATLSARFQSAFLVKGGHLRNGTAADTLHSPGGRPTTFPGLRIDGVRTHGTGCTLSAAIAAGLAKGASLPDAIQSAKTFVTTAITTICRWGDIDALNHSDLP